MTPHQFGRVSRVFLVAKDRPPSNRDDFVAAACSDDGEVHQAVLQMLAANPSADLLARAIGVPDQGETFEILSALRGQLSSLVDVSGTNQPGDVDEKAVHASIAAKWTTILRRWFRRLPARRSRDDTGESPPARTPSKKGPHLG